LFSRCARVVDHLAVRNVAQGAPLGDGSTLRPPNHNVETKVSNIIYREVTGQVVDTKSSGVDAGIMNGSKLCSGTQG